MIGVALKNLGLGLDGIFQDMLQLAPYYMGQEKLF